MPIQFHPKMGEVLYCDFSGLMYDEMSKRRWVVVVSPKYAQSQRACKVVPLSTTAPPVIRDHHCILERDPYPEGTPGAKVWAKCDMLTCVSFDRLTGYWNGKTAGKRNYEKLFVTPADLNAIRKCLLYALGLGALTKHL